MPRNLVKFLIDYIMSTTYTIYNVSEIRKQGQNVRKEIITGDLKF